MLSVLKGGGLVPRGLRRARLDLAKSELERGVSHRVTVHLCRHRLAHVWLNQGLMPQF
jgi:hypothetical protein